MTEKNSKISVICNNCKSETAITRLSFRRYQLRNDTDKYICLTCKNRDKSRHPVTEKIKNRRAEICVATMRLFVEILANEASNMALKVLATGGVYLGGGIPHRILPQLQDPCFMEIFTRKGRFADLMADLPIHVICNPKAALYGAAYYGMEQD